MPPRSAPLVAPTPPGEAPRAALYTRRGCHLCERALDVVEHVRERRAFALTLRDIDAPNEATARAAFRYEIPVLEVGARVLRWPFGPDALDDALDALTTAAPDTSP